VWVSGGRIVEDVCGEVWAELRYGLFSTRHKWVSLSNELPTKLWVRRGKLGGTELDQ
jgi:hypothetical protein